MTLYRKGVGAVIQNQDGFILVGNRVDVPTAWQMPQGGVDDGELPQVALMRELQEELGTCDITIIKKTKEEHCYTFPSAIQEGVAAYWGKPYVGQEQTWFLCTLNANAVVNVQTEHPEFLSTRWISVIEVIDNAVDFKKEMIHAVFKDLGLLKD